MRKIIITESQFKNILLKEYMDSSFNWDEFNDIVDRLGIVHAKKYCIEKLGKPIGEGTSRAVFEIDDHTVLKLSLSKDDVMQNIREWNVFEKIGDNPLLPRIYAHSDDFIWLWSEKVIPCTHEDFEKILGIPYNLNYKGFKEKEDNVGYDDYKNPSDLSWEITDEDENEMKLDFMKFIEWWPDYVNEYESLWDENAKITFRQWIRYPWFQYLIELMEESQNVAEFFDDNLGIAIRNGKPMIVVLDIGF